MKVLLIASVFAGAVLTNVAGADPLICNEPWYTPQPHPPHTMPCHTQGTGGRGQAHSSPRKPHGPTRVPGANPAPPSDTDFGCGFTAVSDQSSDAPSDMMTGQIGGGPILQNGTITCAIQIDSSYHSSPNTASESARGSNGITTLSSTFFSYHAPENSQAYLCTQFNDGTTTYYWDTPRSIWTTNSSTAQCSAAITAGTGPALDLLEELVASPGRDIGDPLTCPVLAGLQGNYGVTTINAQGDVFYLGEPFWDCPPYDLS